MARHSLRPDTSKSRPRSMVEVLTAHLRGSNMTSAAQASHIRKLENERRSLAGITDYRLKHSQRQLIESREENAKSRTENVDMRLMIARMEAASEGQATELWDLHNTHANALASNNYLEDVYAEMKKEIETQAETIGKLLNAKRDAEEIIGHHEKEQSDMAKSITDLQNEVSSFRSTNAAVRARNAAVRARAASVAAAAASDSSSSGDE